jgi:GNAT superfamily N-acetyltransferase
VGENHVNSATVSIRPARLSDASGIAQLTGQLGYELTASNAEVRLSRILSRSDQQFLVAESDARAIGWVHAVKSEYIEAGVFVTIGGLVVDSRYRGHGIGRMLMEQAEDWARQQGCSVVRLWSSAARTHAHRFYEQLGYTNIKTQFSFVKFLDGTEHQDGSKLVPRIEP